jgi:MoxR-like ATPase
MAPHVQDYAVRMVSATQPASTSQDRPGLATPMVEKYVRLGSSPRGAQALVLGAKCRALMDGRYAVSTEDVRATALPALRHRLIMNFESHAEGVTQDAVVRNLVETLPVEG